MVLDTNLSKIIKNISHKDYSTLSVFRDSYNKKTIEIYKNVKKLDRIEKNHCKKIIERKMHTNINNNSSV